MGHRHVFLSVLLIDSGGMVVAQALDHDLAAQGRTHAEAIRAFEQTVFGQLRLDQQLGREPFSTNLAAPAHYWDTWRAATAGLSSLTVVRLTGLEDAAVAVYMIPMRVL